ncbi:TetR/AcrR family transcriptional regulator [Nitratireductor soli]|uniref:TetR/AcrR family transcriptional regulator n=1 Tax=Nitratireductor soli TaxID=1670619 RepID=UPI00065DEB8C|nr:TetR/AcrR family transcriptional regulator [Nitratireductor soli]
MTDDDAQKRQSIGARRNPDTAEAIRAAALAILQEEGYAGFSIEKVARRARAGKPTIYRWWPSKAALLIEVYHAQKRDIDYSVTDDLEHDLVVFLKSLFSHWHDSPSGDVFRSIMAEAQTEPAAREAFLAYIDQRRQRIAEMVRLPRAKSRLAADVDPLMVADLLVSFAWMRLLTNALGNAEADILAMVRSIIHGIEAQE